MLGIHGSSLEGGTIASAQLAPGAVTAASIASNTITAGQLATGAAAANLNASGQSGVAGGGMVLSADPQATNLLDAGYVKVGSMLVDGQVGTANWQRGYASEGTPDARRDHSAVWTGTEMIVWGGITSQYATEVTKLPSAIPRRARRAPTRARTVSLRLPRTRWFPDSWPF